MDTKTSTIFLKIRKHATASLPASALVTALKMVGWELEEVLNLRRVKHYLTNGADSLRFKEKVVPYGAKSEAVAVALAAINQIEDVEVVGDLVVPPPTLKLKRGVVYHSSLTQEKFDEGDFLVESYDWIADKATRITAPNGDQIDLFPKSPSNVWEWVLAHGLDEAVCNYMGLPTLEKEKADKDQARRLIYRHENHCGICSVCLGDYKRTVDNMIGNHGFKRPGDGELHGMCFGEGYPPLEISDEGCVAFRAVLVQQLANAKANLAHWQSGEVKTMMIKARTFPQVEMVEITPEDPRWANELKLTLLRLEAKVRRLESKIAEMDKRIADWVPVPLA